MSARPRPATRAIAILTNTLSGGGAEKQLLLTVAGLCERGHHCCVFCLSSVPPHGRYRGLMQRCRDAGAEFSIPRNPVGVLAVVGRLATAVLSRKVCILWTWGFRAELLRTLFPPLWFVRGVVALRSASQEEVKSRGWLLRASQRLTWRYIANSVRGISAFTAVVPSVHTRGRVTYNALESEFLLAEPAPLLRKNGQLNVHMLGNIIWLTKGYDFAIEVARQVRDRALPIRICIGGRQVDGEPSIQAEIVRAQVAGVVEWRGKIADPKEFLQEADAFMLLSRFEGTPNSLLEAMALGLPCIATDVGDLALFAREDAGITIVPIGAVDVVVDELVRLLRDPATAHKRGLAGRKFCAARFSETRMLDDVESALAS